MSIAIPQYKLSNGVEIPAIGQGTYPMAGDTLYKSLKCALQCGCSLVDTAHSYPNEAEIGKALGRIFSEGSFGRHDVFLTGKIGDRLDNGMPMGYCFYNADSCPDRNHYQVAVRQVEDSLRNLRTDYLDLLLIHWPYVDCLEEIWSAMEDLYQKGVVRAIGVSNHRPRHIERIIHSASVAPMVNQIYFTPLNTQADTLDYCCQRDIRVQAYSPLMFLRRKASFSNDDRISDLSRQLGKSIGQIVLRWNVQHGVVPIPKAAGDAHIRENFDVFDFELDCRQMQLIDSFNEDYQYLPESVYCPGY